MMKLLERQVRCDHFNTITYSRATILRQCFDMFQRKKIYLISSPGTDHLKVHSTKTTKHDRFTVRMYTQSIVPSKCWLPLTYFIKSVFLGFK